MAYIALRDHNWFDWGKDTFPENYLARQQLKTAIVQLGPRPDRKTLEAELEKCNVSSFFDGTPYIEGSTLKIKIHWPLPLLWDIGEIKD